MNTTNRSRKYVLLLLACLTVSLFCVVYPIYIIRPFRHQGPNELALALLVARFEIVTTLIAALTAIAALVGYWRLQPRKWRRALQTIGAILTVALAFLARINIYELMFHPVTRASFTAAPKVKLDGAEKVISVQINGESRAYPIRVMSYHHVLNDIVGGVAIVATY